MWQLNFQTPNFVPQAMKQSIYFNVNITKQFDHVHY